MVPELNETEYESLKAAIRETGRILVPVVMTSDGEIIDGKGRVRATEELKIKDYPRDVVDGLDVEARRLLRLSLNCVRRQLSAEQKREIVRATLRSTPALSNNYLAEITGVDGKTVAKVRDDLETTSDIPKLTAFRGKDGKTRPRHVFTRTNRETKAASEALRKLDDQAPQKLLTAREAIRMANRLEVAATKEDAPTYSDVGPYQASDWVGDVITAHKAKERHDYEQPEAEAEFFIRRTTKMQELVLDPFCGSATTASICKRLNRRCVTTDIDPKAIAVARERVLDTMVGDAVACPKLMVPLVADLPTHRKIKTARMPMEDDDIEFELANPISLPA